MIRRSARNDKSSGCFKYPEDTPTAGCFRPAEAPNGDTPMMRRTDPTLMKTVGDIIETTKRSEERDNASFDRYPWLPKSHTPAKNYKTFEEAYADGYIDGKKDGFKDGVQWMGGN